MYQAAQNRYNTLPTRRCGNSGLLPPAVSLGLWHNFGDTSPYENMRALCRTAFDNGITHFDLANNYGPEPGAAERNFGRILHDDLGVYRDELIISTKAGYEMWDGPYGNWGSRKYLLASLDQSLRRMGLDYVDIFTTTAWILTPRWKKQWARWPRRCAAARRCMSAYPTMTAPRWKKPLRFWTNCMCRLSSIRTATRFLTARLKITA